MDHHFTIGENKRRVLWRYARLVGKAIGWCYHTDNKVLISHKLKGRRRLDTEIHEYLHLVNPLLSEEAVTQQASDLAKILWTLGYRLQEERRKPAGRC